MTYDEFHTHMLTTYPELFTKGFGGFEIHEGWYHIVHSLCLQIKQHQEAKALRGLGSDPLKIMQIKEKFGGIRVYASGADEHVQGLIRMAEAWASNTCEVCGNRGTLYSSSGWLQTLCQDHIRERELITALNDVSTTS